MTILLGITASIAAYRMADLILDLKKQDISVIPVLSKDAHHFVTPLTIQSVAGREVYQDFFTVANRTKPIHIELAKEADLIVVSPASADIIAKIRMGMADDILTCTILAAQSPVLVVPAMNDKMYENAATQENLDVIQKRGIQVLPPIEGQLVCSDYAVGHIPTNDQIIKKIKQILK